MGNRQNPIANRIHLMKAKSNYYMDIKRGKDAHLILEDIMIRKIVDEVFDKVLISHVHIERFSQIALTITIITNRSSLLAGDDNINIVKFKKALNKYLLKHGEIKYGNISVEIENIFNEYCDAELICRKIVNLIEVRDAKNSYNKYIRELLLRVGTKNVKGIVIIISGRINGSTMAKTQKFKAGVISLQSISQPLSYSYHQAKIPTGVLGVKVIVNLNKSETEYKESNNMKFGFNNSNSYKDNYNRKYTKSGFNNNNKFNNFKTNSNFNKNNVEKENK